MTRKFSRIQREADRIRVEPPKSAWVRLEAQLGSYAADRRMKTARVLSIAASVLLITAIGFLGYYFTSLQGNYTSDIYSHRLEPLTVDPAAGSTIYDIHKMKELHAALAN